MFRFVVRRRRVRRKPTKTSAALYLAHKEQARALVAKRLLHWNSVYNFTYNRVAIRNTVSRWGSCSALGNLNFSYAVIFLPEPLLDYLIVHELCHIRELNHQEAFWSLVARTIPDYKKRIADLRVFERETLPQISKHKNVGMDSRAV
jgi:predicted metal-dependent hydrolase